MSIPEKVIVSVCEGKIQGLKNKSSFSGVEFYSFLGVPYGQSTEGYARFKDPVAVKPWKQKFLTVTTEKGGCYQFSTRKRVLAGSEDCLYNNIHTLSLPQKNDEHSLKAVVVNIHPGGFFTGSADPEEFGSPDFVMHNDIVYVCVSFRLDILGFLNLELKDCSGNQGLKDVILSLQWIQKNIRNFGGDPNNVTLLGGSSGAEMVNHLMISPRAKGLFHKAIIMGGYKYNPTLINQDENSAVAFMLAQQFGYTGPFDRRKLLSFFKRFNMSVLSKSYLFCIEDRAPIFPTTSFIVTKDFGENPVVPSTDKRKDLESMMRIPLMIGFCEHEADMGFLPVLRDLTVKNFYTSVRQNSWGWGSKLNDSQLKDIQNRVESYYLDGKSIESSSLLLKCNIQTDISLSDVYDSLIDVIAADLPSSVYVYKFEFEGNTTKLEDLYKYVFEESLPGTLHCNDYFHWSSLQKDDNTIANRLSPETEEMIKTFTKLISTFAKTGNPNYTGISTQWVPTTVDNPCYLSINNNLNMVDGKLNGERMEFWENLRKELETDTSAV